MDLSNNYQLVAYEVLRDSTHKYSSTHVSGNDGEVDSVVEYHSDQDVWVKNLYNGKEEKLQFYSYNIDVLPGHKLLIAYDKETGVRERVRNVTTGNDYAGGIYNEFTKKAKNKQSFFYQLVYPLFGLLYAVPVIGWLFLLTYSINAIIKSKSFYFDAIIPISRKYAILFLIVLLLFCFPFLVVQNTENFKLAIFGVAIGYYIVQFIAISREKNYVSQRAKSLSSLIVDHINRNDSFFKN